MSVLRVRPPSAVDLPPSTGHRAAPPPPSTLPALRAYFNSGWAFLIPYLAVYLLYAWQKWPANPVAGDSPPSTVLSSPSTVFWLPIPPLLYVYWALHAINLVLAALALRSWWKDAQRAAISDQPSAISSDNPARSSQLSVLLPESSGLRSQTSALTSAPAAAPPGPSRLPPDSNLSGFSFQLSVFGNAVSPALPWLLLALLFAIPGVYLEWPSDPCEHLLRITTWANRDLVSSAGADGYKGFYFFAYSWVGWLSPVHLLSWLNVYYVGVCLLLAWQYYLLAKAVGLDRRWAFLSVIVNVLTFGNVCFSFYRYYALATTIYAQIGAVALTRIALEYAKSIGQNDGRRSTVDGSAEQPHPISENQESKALPRRIWRRARSALYSLLTTRYSLLRLGAASGALLLLIAFNHLQGIGIAGLGVGAVIIWRLIEWRRSMAFWLGGIAVVLSVAAVLWWPRQPQIDAVIRPDGWLNAWYGFNLFVWPSPAADRMMQILGIFGMLSGAAGVVLSFRNHIVGWLTVTPVFALGLPFVAIPFANVIAGQIIVYHRVIFAIPAGLAIVVLTRVIAYRKFPRQRRPGKCNFTGAPTSLIAYSFALLVATFFISANSSAPVNNRFWQLSMRPAQDLTLNSYYPECLQYALSPLCRPGAVALSPSPPLSQVLLNSHCEVATASRVYFNNETSIPSSAANHCVTILSSTFNKNLLHIGLTSAFSNYTPYSQAALSCHHWLPQEVALAASGTKELSTKSIEASLRLYNFGDAIRFYSK